MKIRRKIFPLILALIILLIYRGPVFAAPEAMQVSPAIEEISITPGIATSYQLTISNTADRPLGIHVDVTNLQTPDESDQDKTTPSPLISWTQVDPTDTIIPSKQQKIITVTITPPKDIKKGGYYAAIFLTPFINTEKTPNAPIVLTRIGTLLLAQYGETNYSNLKEKTKITDFAFTRLIFEDAPFDFHFTVSNNYFSHFSAKPFLSLTPLFGKSERIPLEEKHILPEKSKVWNETVSPHAPSLFYSVQLAVSVGAGHYVTANTFLFVIPGLHYILLGIILIFLLLIATYHKRARKALTILLTGN